MSIKRNSFNVVLSPKRNSFKLDLSPKRHTFTYTDLEDYPPFLMQESEAAFAFNAIVETYSNLRFTLYSGSTVRVRRSSDNAEQDIGTVGGVFDSATYATFVGGGSGYVVTWYDQSGKGNDATQGTASAQMVISESGGDYYATPDLTDDTYGVTFGSAVNGTLIDARIDGTVEGEIDVASGVWNFNADPNRGVPSPITSLVVYSSVLSEEDRILNRNYIATTTGAGIDFAGVTDMQYWFVNRTDLKKLHCEHFDISLVTTFREFVYNCTNLTTLDVSGWDTANVTTFQEFASGCTNLTTLDVSGWDTGLVTDFNSFVYNCTNLTTLDVSGWDTGLVTGFILFAYNCTNLTTLDTSGWNTANVTNYNSFAYNCTNLTTLDTSGWNTANVTNFKRFSYKCTNLTTLDVSGWNTAKVTDFREFAFKCNSLTALDVSGWNTAKVTEFAYFVTETQIVSLDVSGWDTGLGTSFEAFVFANDNLTALDVSSWDTSNVTTFAYFANVCRALTTITTEGGTGNPFSDSPCTNYIAAFSFTNLDQTTIDNILTRIDAAATSSGTFAQTGGTAPSATGEAGVDGLRARSWTVTVQGGY